MKGKKQEYTFGLRGISLIEKYFDGGFVKPIDGNLLEYNISSNPIIDKEKKLFFQFVKVEIKEKGDDSVKGAVTIACAFSITGNVDIFSDDNRDNEVNSRIEIKTRLESLSTLRGVVFSEFRGTNLTFAVIPLINEAAMKKAE